MAGSGRSYRSVASASTYDTARSTAANGGDAKKLLGALVFSFALVNLFDVGSFLSTNGPAEGRRSLLSTLYLAGSSTLMPWAEHYVVDVTDRPNPEKETALFWHIPKSGGTTAKRLYQCMGRTLAHRVGADPRFGHDKAKEIVVFEPHAGKDWKVVNVDTTIKKGILRAKELGLVQSRTTDLIFTMEPNFAGQNLYDEENKGRFLGLFRHPVERALSMFYYLQTATWERTYSPEWADMSVMEWASQDHFETDYMVHKLVGKSFGDEVDETDLIIAKELVRQRFIVGLISEMNESIRRFNIVLGVDENSARGHSCMEEYGLLDETVEAESEKEGDVDEETQTMAKDKKNSHKHPKFEEGSEEFEAIADRNKMDILLYKYVETLFEAQKDIVDSFQQASDDLAAEMESVEAELNDSLPQVDAEVAAEMALLPPGSAMPVDIPPKIDMHLANVGDEPQNHDTPFFWHVPKSGGTTLQRLYWCMGSTVANEVGANPKFGNPTKRRGLVSFNPWDSNPGKVINVDVSTKDGILEAKNRGFLGNNVVKDPDHPHVDFVSTPEFQFAAGMLFTPFYKARMFALFRHPVERAVSKFFYLQKATWEPTYNPKWAKMSVDEWASHNRGEDNWMIRNLVDIAPLKPITDADVEIAKEIIRTKFVVGLMERMEKSIHRFNYFLGIDESDPVNAQCIEDYASTGNGTNDNKNTKKIVKKNNWNSYAHPKVERGSKAWNSLIRLNSYDVQLYMFIVETFHAQTALFPYEQGIDEESKDNERIQKRSS